MQSIEFLAVRQLFRNHDFADLLFKGHRFNSFALALPGFSRSAGKSGIFPLSLMKPKRMTGSAAGRSRDKPIVPVMHNKSPTVSHGDDRRFRFITLLLVHCSYSRIIIGHADDALSFPASIRLLALQVTVGPCTQ